MNTLLNMCLQGSAMIIVVLTLRALFSKRLPKAAFYVLWLVVLIRLLVPVQIEVPFNAWSAFQNVAASHVAPLAPAPTFPTEKPSAPPQATPSGVGIDIAVTMADSEPLSSPAGDEEIIPVSLMPTLTSWANAPIVAPASGIPGADAWQVVWIAGAVLSALAFVAAYTRQIKRFSSATPVQNQAVAQWLQTHALPVRTVRIVESSLVGSPLTYGIARPTVVVPPGFDWSNRSQSTLVLEHDVVETSSSYYDGENYYYDETRAYEEALKYASWIEPA